jgi:surfactin synthase thioesterase subunit
LLLPTLRADVEMHEGYSPRSKKPISAAITSIRGRDDHLVSHEEATAWQHATSGSFEIAEVAGSHMYLIGASDDVVRLIEERAFAISESSDQ